MSSNPKNKKTDKRTAMVRIVCVVLCLLMVGSLLINAIIVASAKSSSELKKELDALKNEAQEIINAGLELQDQLDANASETQTTIQQKSAIDQQITITEAEIQNANAQIRQYSLLIAAKQSELEDSLAELEAMNSKYKARLRAMEEADFAALPYGSEGLWRKVMHACRTRGTLGEIVGAAKSKRYTHTRLMRMLLCAFLGISAALLEQPAPYVHILAMDDRGRRLLRQMHETSSIPLLHPGQTPPEGAYAALERRAADLYGLFREGTVAAPGRREQIRYCPPAD